MAAIVGRQCSWHVTPMYPTLVRFGDFELTTFGALVAIAALVGLWIFHRELARGGLPESGLDAALMGVLGGLAGAKLVWAIEFRQRRAISLAAAQPRRAQLVRRISRRCRRRSLGAPAPHNSDRAGALSRGAGACRSVTRSDVSDAFSSATTTAGRLICRGPSRFRKDCRRRLYPFIRRSSTKPWGWQSSPGYSFGGGEARFQMPKCSRVTSFSPALCDSPSSSFASMRRLPARSRSRSSFRCHDRRGSLNDCS